MSAQPAESTSQVEQAPTMNAFGFMNQSAEKTEEVQNLEENVEEEQKQENDDKEDKQNENEEEGGIIRMETTVENQLQDTAEN